MKVNNFGKRYKSYAKAFKSQTKREENNEIKAIE